MALLINSNFIIISSFVIQSAYSFLELMGDRIRYTYLIIIIINEYIIWTTTIASIKELIIDAIYKN